MEFKKKFEAPELEITELPETDIVCASGDDGWSDWV